jgi:mono/diheme cytochrome c family protein
MQTVAGGRNSMPAFSANFTPEQIRDVSAYVVRVLADADGSSKPKVESGK